MPIPRGEKSIHEQVHVLSTTLPLQLRRLCRDRLPLEFPAVSKIS
jgi:hypothetical protein